MLSAEAHAVLAEQIEALSPSAAVLESKGVDWETAATLARFIKTGEPDVTTLKDHGLPLDQCVAICTAISARHARKTAALAAVPAPSKPTPKPAAPAPDAMHGMTALSMFHTLCVLCEQGAAGRAPCLTSLVEDGWSPSTAKEIFTVIEAARRAR